MRKCDFFFHLVINKCDYELDEEYAINKYVTSHGIVRLYLLKQCYIVRNVVFLEQVKTL